MKKILLPLAAVLLLAMAVPAFAEWELGLGWTPNQGNTSDSSGDSRLQGPTAPPGAGGRCDSPQQQENGSRQGAA